MLSIHSRCAIAALFGLALPGVARAEPVPQPSPSPSPLATIGRVSTSDRRDEPIGETSRPTFVVDRAHIDDIGARTIGDALVGVPGVELFSYGGFGAQTDFGIRGATSARTLVLVDGQPVADPTTGSVDLTQLSTVGVGRIEIVESATSSLYGTSASGGIINVITAVPRGTYLEGSVGSYQDRDVRVGIGNGTIGGTFERHVADNAYAYPSFTYCRTGCANVFGSPLNYPAAVRENAYGDQTTGRVSADVPLGNGFALRGRVDATTLDIGVPGRLDFLTPNATTRTANETGLLEIARSTRYGTLSLDVSGAAQRSAYADPSFGEDDTAWGRSQISLKDTLSSPHADLVAGIDLTRASGAFAFPSSTTPASGTTPATSTPAYGVGASQSQTAAYVQVGTEPLAGTRLVAGLRAERDSPAGSVLAPSVGTTLHLGRHVRLAGNVGESFVVPSLELLYYPFDANPRLLPEKSADRDATIRFDTRGGTITAGWFGRSGSNFIVDDPVTFVPYNAQRAQTEGVAITARSAPFRGFVADANFTDLYRALDRTTGARLPHDPVGQASVGLTKPFGTTRTAFGIRFGVVGSDGDDTANVPPPLVGRYDSYTSLDAYVRFQLAKHSVLSLNGFDLGNDREAPIFGYPNLGRRLVVGLSTR